MSEEPYNGYGWQSNLDTFSNSPPRVVRGHLSNFLPDSSPEQLRAWDRSIPWLQRECRELTSRYSAASEYTAVLEYQLPRDSRRPDVLILEDGCVAVLELKGHLSPSQAALDQAMGYARDLASYHAACAACPVTPVLLLPNFSREAVIHDGVYVVAPEGLDSLLQSFARIGEPRISIDAFLAPDAYSPLPTIVQAARDLFNRKPLPKIKRAQAATTPALNHITAIAHAAARTRTRHLVLLSGVPGSGKTLVGLQLVHAGWIDDLAVARSSGKPTAPAVYLSGNGPLVAVLQDALKDGGGGGRTFVQSIKNYVSTYSRRGAPPPPEHLIVFDEAQRAHDKERVAYVHDKPVGKSEPQLLLEFCERIPEWSVLVALIGDGQAIHVGEEGGVALWSEALRKVPGAESWFVHGPPSLASHFRDGNCRMSSNDVLNLDTEIRFHLTPNVHHFVNQLLQGHAVGELQLLANVLHDAGHRFLVTRNLDAGKSYLRLRYADASSARFGMLASSRDKWLADFEVDNSFQTTKRLRVGPWYNADASDPQSCRQLDAVATEFSSQGLELDCALVAWGSDLLWESGSWSIAHSRRTMGTVRDPMSLRKNVYRVLLTRGRDGSVIYVPDDPRFDATFFHLRDVGLKELH